MGSFASKVKANDAYKAAAKAQGLKPNQVKTKQAFQRVKAYAAGQKSATSDLPAGGGQNTPVAGGGQQTYTPATIGGNSFNAGVNLYSDIANRFPRNEIVGGEVVGGLVNAAGSLVNLGIADQYTRNTLGALGEYNAGEDRRRTGYTKELMSTEAALTGDLYRAQGEQQRLGYVTQGEQERLNIAATGREQRLGYVTQGEQERETLGRKTTEERKLRADARGAIRSQGARFYG